MSSHADILVGAGAKPDSSAAIAAGTAGPGSKLGDWSEPSEGGVGGVSVYGGDTNGV